ncbi:MAG TPA: hypothetical protein DHV62_05000 [Elusimicrobia bacterium]|nr:hypothetical protein [Elusimicrobiota bacterium]
MIEKNNPLLAKIEDIFVETAGDLARSLSINPVVGQLYALLYIRPESVSLDEMAEKLKISKGNVSINIRILESWQAVKKVWIKGSRKDYYTAETDFLKIVTNRLTEGLARRLNTTAEPLEKIKTILNNSQAKFSSEEKNRINFYKTKTKQFEEIHNLVLNFLKVLPSLNLLKQRNSFFRLLTLA